MSERIYDEINLQELKQTYKNICLLVDNLVCDLSRCRITIVKKTNDYNKYVKQAEHINEYLNSPITRVYTEHCINNAREQLERLTEHAKQIEDQLIYKQKRRDDMFNILRSAEINFRNKYVKKPQVIILDCDYY